jgi:hypothetical protein
MGSVSPTYESSTATATVTDCWIIIRPDYSGSTNHPPGYVSWTLQVFTGTTFPVEGVSTPILELTTTSYGVLGYLGLFKQDATTSYIGELNVYTVDQTQLIAAASPDQTMNMYCPQRNDPDFVVNYLLSSGSPNIDCGHVISPYLGQDSVIGVEVT